jgi:hypothetical protein
MGGALGWFVVALAGLAGAPPAERAKPQITYTVQTLEAQGVDWREGVFDRLKPVTRQGAATVWTVPREAVRQLVDGCSKSTGATILQSSKVTAWSGVPATIQCRRNRPVVIQAAWNGQDPASTTALENVRVGWHTTMVGRKLDQGILVQLVFEDTAVRAVHHVKVNRSVEHRRATAAAEEKDCCASPEKATGLMAIAHSILGSEEACCASQTTCSTGRSTGKDDNVQKVVLDVPEIETHEILGEWLVPCGEALLVSFGVHTVADKDGMAVVKERLAIIEADEANKSIALVGPKGISPVPVRVFTPHASEFAVPPRPMIGSSAQGNVSIVPLLPPPTPTIALPDPAPAVRMAAPPPPSRSIPQGVHADGTPADLPPLPADETEPDSSSSDSSEPRPSPQTKKIPQPKPVATPATDTGMNKAEFTLPKAAAMFVPSIFMPSSSTGFQFLLPIKPLSLKLPFGQRLEIELVGRMVPDANGQDSTGSEPTVARSR